MHCVVNGHKSGNLASGKFTITMHLLTRYDSVTFSCTLNLKNLDDVETDEHHSC